jgi:hypothetical protein
MFRDLADSAAKLAQALQRSVLQSAQAPTISRRSTLSSMKTGSKQKANNLNIANRNATTTNDRQEHICKY